MYTNSFGSKLALTLPLYSVFSQKSLIKTTIKPILKNKHAFTLAETLITLTIIGVIAAMTVPTLITNYTKHTYVVGLKKAYSELSHAMKIIPVTEGCSGGDYDCAGITDTKGNIYWGANSDVGNIKILAKQFKVTKVYNAYTDDTCDVLNNPTYGGFMCFFTNDGMLWGGTYGFIRVDINGPKGPNKWGRDMFQFATAATDRNGVKQGTIMPYGSKILAKYENDNRKYWKNLCKTNNVTADCTGRVLEEGAMNY